MKKKYARLLYWCLLFLGVNGLALTANAINVTINATGTTGSYRTGSVSSAGVKNDDAMVTINSSSNRGFASFDLSTIPIGAVINSVSVEFTTYTSTSSSANNPIYGFIGDPSTIAGNILYTNAGSGTNFNSSSWTANATNTKVLNATGIAFIQTNVGGTYVNIGFVRGSTNTYNIYGYGATSAQQPKLIIDYTAPTPCTGPLSPITITSTTTVACVNAAFSITSSGVPLATGGVAYQWQTSTPSANTFVDVSSNGNAANFTVNAQATATDYRLRVVCTNTNDTTYSNIFAVGQNPFYNCYCTPASTCTNEGIDSVGIGTFSNTSAFCVGSGYSDYAGLGSAGTFTQAQAVSVTVKAHINSNPASAGLWIDYDQNGTFDASEFTSLGSAAVTIPSGGTEYIFTATVNIPATAATGITRMRIRSANQGSVANTSACTATGLYGEFEDYLITINAGTPCTGTPVAGTISGVTTACAGIPFTLNATGYTNGVTGLSYEWQVYNTVTSSWDPAPGTNNGLSYTATSGITSATDFRFTITCANGGGFGNTATQSVVITPANQCYCVPAGTNSNYYINNFYTTGGITDINNLGTGHSAGGYGDYTATDTASILVGNVLTIHTAYGSGSNTFGTKVWIDFDGDGNFTTTGDQVYASSSYVNTATIPITIPASANPITTRLRIGNSYTPSTGPSGPCLTTLNGEYEDYTITLVGLIPCSGTPTAGTITGPTGVCANQSFTLQASGFTTGSGLTYLWEQYNTITSAWDPAPGTNNTGTYTLAAGISTPTDFRFTVTCTNGGASASTATQSLSINTFVYCYCIPASGCTNEGIDSVGLGTFSNTSAFCVGTGYSDYASLGSIGTVVQAQIVPLVVKAKINSNPASVGVWIDYDHNGIFDASEYTAFANAVGVTPLPSEYIFSGNITISPTALTGITRMRIRSANQSGITATSACTNTGVYGEYEDYLITINAGNLCSGTPTAGTISGATSVCSGINFTLTANGYTTGTTGLTYEWQVFNTITSAWDPAPGTNNSTTYTAVGGITTATDYRFTVLCNNGGGTDATGTYSITLKAPNQCYCIPAGNNSNYYINNLSTTGGAKNISKLASGYAPSGYGDYSATDTVSIPASLSFTLNAGYGSGSNTFGTKIWIDFDGDGDFTTTGDQVYGSSSYVNSISQVIAIPSTATPITTRMRIGISYTPSTGPSGPCLTTLNGEYEDYTIIILPAPSCLPPTALAVSNTTYNATDAQWNQSLSSPALGYTWRVVAQGAGVNGTIVTSGNEPAGDTVANITGLTATTNYTLYVRSICNIGDSSIWASVDFATACSTAVAPLAMSFDVTGTPNCWTNTTTPESWLFSQGAGPDYGVAGSTDHTGNSGYFAWVDGSGTGTNQGITLTSVPVDISAFTTPNLSFYVKSYNSDDGALNKLIVQGSNGANWVNLDSIQMNFPTNGWYNRQVVLTGLLSNVTQFRFRVDESNAGGSAFYNDILLDDIQVTNGPLAIKMGTLSATNMGSRNRVDWNTLSEDAGDRFVLERSADGRSYTELTTIEGKGKANTYSYWDHSPVQGINYYRLKLVSVGNSTTYSSVATATVKGNGTFAVDVYPNPVSNQLNVEVYGAQGNNPVVTITDVTGKVVLTQTLNGKSAIVNMTGITAGFYLVKYTDSNHNETIKVNKQ